MIKDVLDQFARSTSRVFEGRQHTAGGSDIGQCARKIYRLKMEGDPEYLLLFYPLNMKDLAAKVPGDPRWSGSTALHAAVVSGQPSIVQYLVDHGAKVDAKTKSGWTPLMMANGVFFANAKKEFPAAAAILKKAMAEQGLTAAVTSPVAPPTKPPRP